MGPMLDVIKLVVVAGALAMLLKIAPIDETFKRIGMIVVAVIAILWALSIVARLI